MTSPQRTQDASRDAPHSSHAPHEALMSYYPDEARRRSWLRGIFDRTAPDYDAIERAMAFGSVRGIGIARCARRGWPRACACSTSAWARAS